MMMIPQKIKISCGACYNNILYKNKIYVCGRNFRGQLGLGDHIDRETPTEITLHKNIKSIVCGWDITVAFVSNSKELYIWGCNDSNEFGSMYDNAICSPTKFILNVDSNIKSVMCGFAQIIILLQSGVCYSWGLNSSGQLGLGHTNIVSSPQKITSLGSDIIKIICGCGSEYTIVITKFGKCYTWGANDFGQLGLGHDINEHSPKELPLQNILSISCGRYHTIVITIDMKIYVWGLNEYGQLGLGHNINQNSPQELLFQDIKIESVSCGFHHTMALTMSGKLYVWGKNDSGQLGLGDNVHRNFPQEVYFKEKINSIRGGASHTLCTTYNGKIYTWGDNGDGQLGLSDNKNRSEPCELEFFS